MIRKCEAVCFTGHRNVKETIELKSALTKQLLALIEDGATDFYAGGAVGWDMLCESSVIDLREHFSHIKLHIVLPSLLKSRPINGAKTKKRVSAAAVGADTVRVCSEHYFNGCMKNGLLLCRTCAYAITTENSGAERDRLSEWQSGEGSQ